MGITRIGHNAENSIEIKSCNASSDCFKRDVVYENIPKEQMVALIDLSLECSQKIYVRPWLS